MKSYSHCLFLLLLSLATFADQPESTKSSFVQKCKDHKLKLFRGTITITTIVAIYIGMTYFNNKLFQELITDFQKTTSQDKPAIGTFVKPINVAKAKEIAKALMRTGESWFASSNNKKVLKQLQNQSDFLTYFID